MSWRDIRIGLALSQEAFWGRIGLTQSAGSRFEAGRLPPEPVQMLLELAYGTRLQQEQVLRRLRIDAATIPSVARVTRRE